MCFRPERYGTIPMPISTARWRRSPELAKPMSMNPFLTRALIATAATFGAGPALAQPDCTGPASPVRFYVNVEGVRASQGLIAVTLYADDSRRFLARRGSLYVGRVPARAGTTRICIHLPSTGTW